MRKDFMQRKDSAPPRLRVYYGPETSPATTETSSNLVPRIRVSLGEIFPLLADAVRSERAWLADFADDELQIPTDLYEVLLAYQHYRRPSA